MTNNNKQKKFIIIILISIAIIGAAYLFTTHKNNASIPPQIVDQSSSLTVYTNTTFGYSLKFSDTYQIIPQTAKHISQVGVDNNIAVEKKSDSNGAGVIVIDVYIDKDNLSLKDYMNNNLKMFDITGPLVSYNFNGYDSLFNRNQPGTNVFVKSGNNIYHITAATSSTDKEISDIVATFRFTQ